MIVFKHLHFENVLFYKEVDLPLENQGVVFIGGKNSSGKSLIFSVLCNILFRSSPLGGPRKQIAGKNYFGALDFEIDDNSYRIEQFFNHKKYGNGYRIYKNGKDLKIAGGIPKCEAFIKELLPITSDEYYNFHFLTQDNFHALVYGKPSDCSSFYSAAFGLEAYDRIREAIKELIRDINDKLSESRNVMVKVNVLKESLGTMPDKSILKEKYEEVLLKLKTYEKKKEELDGKISEIKEQIRLKERLSYLKKKLKKFGNVIPPETIAKEKDYLEDRVKTLEQIVFRGDRKAQLIKELKESNGEKYSHYSIDSLRKRLEELRRLLKERSLIRKRAKYENTIRMYQKRIVEENCEEKLKEAERKRAHTEEAISTINKELKKLSSLKDKAVCDKCFRPIDDPKFVVQQIKNRKEARQKYEQELSAIDKTIEQLEKQVKALRKIEAIKARVDELPSGDLSSLVDISDEIQTLEHVLSLREKLSEYRDISVDEYKEAKEKLPKIKKMMEALKREEANTLKAYPLMKELSSINKKLGDKHLETYGLKKKLKRAEKRKKDIDRSVSKLSMSVGKLQRELEEIKRIEKELKTLTPDIKRIEKRERKMKLLNALYKAYAPDKLKLDRIHDINSTVVSYLNMLAPMIFESPIVFSSVKKSDSSAIYFRKLREKGQERSVRFLSGGMKKRLMLLLIPVISSLVPSSKQSNLIILDEVDANVDDIGTSLIGETLIPFLKKKYNSIFMLGPAIKEGNDLKTRIPLEEFNKVMYTNFGKIEILKS